MKYDLETYLNLSENTDVKNRLFETSETIYSIVFYLVIVCLIMVCLAMPSYVAGFFIGIILFFIVDIYRGSVDLGKEIGKQDFTNSDIQWLIFKYALKKDFKEFEKWYE